MRTRTQMWMTLSDDRSRVHQDNLAWEAVPGFVGREGMTSETSRRENAHPARNAKAISILDLAERVHRGELTPEEAVQIFERSKAPAAEDEAA